MKKNYSQALLALIEDGIPIETAISGLQNLLKKRRQQKLFLPVLKEVLQILSTRNVTDEAIVTLASEKISDKLQQKLKETLKTLGAGEETVITERVDKTLIGGFVATYNYKEYDQSYKSALKLLSDSITA